MRWLNSVDEAHDESLDSVAFIEDQEASVKVGGEHAERRLRRPPQILENSTVACRDGVAVEPGLGRARCRVAHSDEGVRESGAMIHVRVISPPDRTPRLLETLQSDVGVVSLVVVKGAAQSPLGDAVEFDVINAETNRVLDELRGLELHRFGLIAIDNVDTVLSERAERAERAEPALASLSPIWQEAETRIKSLGTYPPSWFALLTIAGLIGAVGILTNSQILIVAAMVIGPEYGAIINVALGLRAHDHARVRSGMRALTVGFAIAILAALVFGLAIRALDLQPRAFELGIRPVSQLINTPNVYSVVVAVLAGIVGVVSLTEARANTLIGVFISVTTIPAAADIGISAAFGSFREARGSLFQLLLNISILIAIGTVGLGIQRRVWRRWAGPAGPDL